MQYIGRFAPSPTGPLHFGSLVAAVASYCDARANQGKWLLRMEDVDKPREMQGAAENILRTLAVFGFEWDGEVFYQSQRHNMYAAAFNQLQHQQLIYPCICSRKEIADSATTLGIEGAIYPQTCFNKTDNSNARENHGSAIPLDTSSWRINVDNAGLITFNDATQGSVSQQLAHDVGDFILKRKDGLFSYQLAVVVDDALQGVTHIVRGADLLDSTPRQIYLQHLLGVTTPFYAHVPVMVNADGQKLSKQTLAKSINAETSTALVFEALRFLGQRPPADIKNATLEDIWSWAVANWQLDKIPQQKLQIYNS